MYRPDKKVGSDRSDRAVRARKRLSDARRTSCVSVLLLRTAIVLADEIWCVLVV